MKHQVVGYIRVSSEGQNTARQLIGIEVDRMFTDIMTGSVKSRPELEECLKYIREGDTLVVDSIDRLARNLRSLQEILGEILQKGASVRFIKENLTFTSQDDPMSMLMIQMMGAFAEFERNMIRIRQREGIDLAKKEGRPLGRRPTLTEKHKNKAKEMREQGISIRKIAFTMNLSRPSIYKLLGLYPKI